MRFFKAAIMTRFYSSHSVMSRRIWASLLRCRSDYSHLW